MSQSSTLFLGMDGHQETMAVADGAQDHGAEVPYLGAMGPRLCAIAGYPLKAGHPLTSMT